MLTLMNDHDRKLLVKNVVAACRDIEKLNKRGYNYLYCASGFIAHYNISGFIDHYSSASLRQDILDNLAMNCYDNFRPGERDYEYYHQKAAIYQEICVEIVKNEKLYKEITDKISKDIKKGLIKTY